MLENKEIYITVKNKAHCIKVICGVLSLKVSRGRSIHKIVFAKRSVVSAANYAVLSSFAKDQILFFISIEVNPHASEVRIQPNFFSSFVSSRSGFDTWKCFFVDHIEHMFIRMQEKNSTATETKKQQNCRSFESTLCKICFTEQIINKCDT